MAGMGTRAATRLPVSPDPRSGRAAREQNDRPFPAGRTVRRQVQGIALRRIGGTLHVGNDLAGRQRQQQNQGKHGAIAARFRIDGYQSENHTALFELTAARHLPVVTLAALAKRSTFPAAFR